MSDSEKQGARIFTSITCCEKLLYDRSHVASAIGITDVFGAMCISIVPNLPDGTPDSSKGQLIIPPFKLFVLVVFRGAAGSEFDGELRAVTPSGRIMNISNAVVARRFKIPDDQYSLTMNGEFMLTVEEQGNYRFQVYVDGALDNEMIVRIFHDLPPEATGQQRKS